MSIIPQTHLHRICANLLYTTGILPFLKTLLKTAH